MPSGAIFPIDPYPLKMRHFLALRVNGTYSICLRQAYRPWTWYMVRTAGLERSAHSPYLYFIVSAGTLAPPDGIAGLWARSRRGTWHPRRHSYGGDDPQQCQQTVGGPHCVVMTSTGHGRLLQPKTATVNFTIEQVRKAPLRNERATFPDSLNFNSM